MIYYRHFILSSVPFPVMYHRLVHALLRFPVSCSEPLTLFIGAILLINRKLFWLTQLMKNAVWPCDWCHHFPSPRQHFVLIPLLTMPIAHKPIVLKTFNHKTFKHKSSTLPLADLTVHGCRNISRMPPVLFRYSLRSCLCLV